MIVDTVTVAGRPIDAGSVLADVQVEHGRGGFGADPEASRASITVRTGILPSWATGGDLLHLSGPYGPVFTGRITDLGVVHPADGAADVTVTAVGMLADLGRAKVGDEPWPVEAAHDRAARILQLADPPGGWTVQAPGVESEVTGRDVDAKTPIDLLAELAATTGGAVFDTPEGEIVYQPLASRQTPVYPARWRDLPAALTWAESTRRWNGFGNSPDSRPVLDIPSCFVEWEPRWGLGVGSVVNAARVLYGAEGDSGSDRPVAEVADARSIARHGKREARIDSQWVHIEDAMARARRIVTTQAQARWEIDGAAVILDEAPEQLRQQVVGLRVGDGVRLSGLPDPSPASAGAWVGLVEGWTLQQTVDEAGQMARLVMRLSERLLSLVVARWRDAPADLRWREVATKWADVDWERTEL